MNIERAVTYSLLAHIRNTATLAKGPLDIFSPLIKRTISQMNSENIFNGKSISEIKEYADKLYSIDFPIPVLKSILNKIASEINTQEKTYFTLNNDDSFSIANYTFTQFEETINTQKKEIENLEKLFKNFCESSEIEIKNSKSIFDFIEKNKLSLGKYLSNKEFADDKDYSIEANFIKFFSSSNKIYDLVKSLYLGSILSAYIEYKPIEAEMDVELLLDTNFIISIIDLNTPESTHTCRSLLKIAKTQNYKLSILIDTIGEIKSLLKKRCEYFNESFLIKKIYPEDIYNACDRRKLNKIDLERITDNIEDDIIKYDISIIRETDSLKDEAKLSKEYEYYKNIRITDISALHDACAIIYVKNKRIDRIKEFDQVNCWFVNNAISREGSTNHYCPNRTYQSEIIKVDELLNILWLSNPQAKSIVQTDDIADISLSSLISLTLTENLPKTSIIQELDDNIHKYANETLSDTDIVRVANRITNKQLKDIKEINQLAKTNKEEFIKRLEFEAKKQKDLEERFSKKIDKFMTELAEDAANSKKIFTDFEEKTKELSLTINLLKKDSNSKDEEIIQLKKEIEEKEEKEREKKRNEEIKKKITNWQRKSFIPFIISFLIILITVIFLLYLSDWNSKKAMMQLISLRENIIVYLIFTLITPFFGYTIKLIYDSYFNHSNIENFKKRLNDLIK